MLYKIRRSGVLDCSRDVTRSDTSLAFSPGKGVFQTTSTRQHVVPKSLIKVRSQDRRHIQEHPHNNLSTISRHKGT